MATPFVVALFSDVAGCSAWSVPNGVPEDKLVIFFAFNVTVALSALRKGTPCITTSATFFLA
jgi:hypothetical protein